MNKNIRHLLEGDNLSAIGIELFGMYKNYHHEPMIEEHVHEKCVEICYLERGCQTYSTQGKEYELTGGDVFVTFPNELHSSSNIKQLRGCLYWIQFNMESSNLLGLGKDDTEILKSCLLSIPIRHYRISGQTASLLTRAFKNFSSGTALTQIVAKALIIMFVYDLAAETVSIVNPDEPSEEISRCLEYIENHIRENITVSDLADVVNFSESHLKLKFKREMGIPPRDYIINKKINASTEFLKTQSVTDTAYEFGFSSSQHYTRAFRNVIGMSPRDYKKELHL